MSIVVDALFAGVPSTGKTTYLGILYLAISSEQQCSVKLGSFKDDREYMNQIGRKLFDCEEAAHTGVGTSDGLALSVMLPNGVNAMLRVPDLSGETWDAALADRIWTADLDTRVRNAAGVCIFIHAGEFDMDPTFAEVERAALALGTSPGDAQEPGYAEYRDPRLAATQVQIVDLLQLLCEDRAKRPSRVSIVISAFDLTGLATAPQEWLWENGPLVGQYLEVNSSWLESRVFGLSAQGGRFDEEESRANLAKISPLSRAFIQRGNGSAASFDEPVLWATGHV